MLRTTTLRKFLLIILLTLWIASQAITVSAGINVWTSIGPAGGNVSALAIDPQTPTTLYTGIYNVGLVKSTDGGGTWANTGLPSTPSALAIDPVTTTTLYAGIDYSGVYKSVDGGGNWSNVDVGLMPDTDDYVLAIDPATPTTLYVAERFDNHDGTKYGYVFKSVDSGGNWAITGLPNTEVYYALAIDPLTPTTLYAGTYDKVFKSTDGGGHWNAANTGLTGTDVSALAIDPATPTTLYAGTWGGGVVKSMDGGENWDSIGLTGTDVSALVIDPATPTTLYAGTWGGGVFKSTDGGENWSAFNTGLPVIIVSTLAIDPKTPAILYAGTDGGGVFVIQQAQSGSFAKTTPANTASGISVNPTLSWGTSIGAASYEYCYDTSNDNACSVWTSTGANTSVGLSGLNPGTTYYWQVRAMNSLVTTYADGAATAFWSFTTGNVPGAFAKATPANTASGISVNPTLSWGTSIGAATYEYCYDITNDNACSVWTSTSTNTSVGLSGLSLNTIYYWQVRAVNSIGTNYADGGTWWRFTTNDTYQIFLPAVKNRGD